MSAPVLLAAAAMLGALSFFEPCTIATHARCELNLVIRYNDENDPMLRSAGLRSQVEPPSSPR